MLVCPAMALSAQNLVIWKGGAPGQNANRNCFKNWSNCRVPDEFSTVMIPDVSTTTHATLVIYSGNYELNLLQLRPNAQLTMEAKLGFYNLEHKSLCGQGQHKKNLLVILNEVASEALKDGFAKR
jgi:hypothetical protein